MARIKDPNEPSVADLEAKLAALLVDVADATDETTRKALTAEIEAVEEALTRRRVDEERAARRAKLAAQERERRERQARADAEEAQRQAQQAKYETAGKTRAEAGPKLDAAFDHVCAVIEEITAAGETQWIAGKDVHGRDAVRPLRDAQALARYCASRLFRALPPGARSQFEQNAHEFADGRGGWRTFADLDAWATRALPYTKGALAQDLEAEQQAREVLGAGPDDVVHFHALGDDSDDLGPYVVGPDGDRYLIGNNADAVTDEPEEAA